jgi:hypothetical protein
MITGHYVCSKGSSYSAKTMLSQSEVLAKRHRNPLRVERGPIATNTPSRRFPSFRAYPDASVMLPVMGDKDNRITGTAVGSFDRCITNREHANSSGTRVTF